MIRPEGRLWAGSGNLLFGGPYTWYITDFDQRRNFSVTYDPPTEVTDVEGTEEICLEKLRQHIDELGADVLGIRFADSNGPITTSSNKEDDVTFYTNCDPLSALQLPFAVRTIRFGNLTELDRFGPQVDLVTYQGDPAVGDGAKKKVAFKYWFVPNGKFRKWYELQCWSRLPRDHPHIVPFDAVVLDDVRGGVVGFTSLYIPGGTLDSDTSRVFRLEWLKQLLSVVDDLNYRYGIMHQDIAPRNLLIDEKDNLCIFDYNFSVMIAKHYTPERDDLKGVVFTLYEIITRDESYRRVPHAEQDAEAVLRLEWVKHPDVKLDHDVQDYRTLLEAWVDERRGRAFTPMDTWLEWGLMPDPPPAPVPLMAPDGTVTGREMQRTPSLMRADLIQLGEPYLDWERPASYKLKAELGKQRDWDAARLNGN